MQKAQHHIGSKHRGAAAGEQGKGNADDGEHCKAHADVQDKLYHQHRTHADANQSSKIRMVSGSRDMKYTNNHYGKDEQNERSAQKAEFLTDGGINKIGMRGRECFIIGAAHDTASEDAACGNCLLAHQGLHSLAQRVNFGIEANQNASLLVWLQMLPQKGKKKH